MKYNLSTLILFMLLIAAIVAIFCQKYIHQKETEKFALDYCRHVVRKRTFCKQMESEIDTPKWVKENVDPSLYCVYNDDDIRPINISEQILPDYQHAVQHLTLDNQKLKEEKRMANDECMVVIKQYMKMNDMWEAMLQRYKERLKCWEPNHKEK